MNLAEHLVPLTRVASLITVSKTMIALFCVALRCGYDANLKLAGVPPRVIRDHVACAVQ